MRVVAHTLLVTKSGSKIDWQSFSVRKILRPSPLLSRPPAAVGAVRKLHTLPGLYLKGS